MATIAELQAEEARLSAEFNRVQRELRASGNPDSPLATQREQLRSALVKVRREIAVASNQSAATGTYEGQDSNTGLYRYKNPVTGNSFLSGTAPTAEQQAASGIRLEPPAQPQPPETASGAAQAAAPAGPTATPGEQINSAGQTTTPPAVTTPTNAEVPATTQSGAGVDTGLNAPVKTLEQTQATSTEGSLLGGRPLTAAPSGSILGGLEPGQFTGAVAPTSPGVGSNDENQSPTSASRQTEVNANQATALINPQPNVLDKYSSYSYVASVYLTSQQQYQKLAAGTDKKIDGYQLLFQSAGAPVSNGVIRDNQTFSQTDPNNPATTTSNWKNYPQASRNPFFDADFYIDNITLTTLTLGQATGSAHAASELKFTVIEPLGITLLSRLYKAVQNFSPIAPGSNKVNYTSATYLMVIRFYGYDEAGNLVMPIRGGLQTPGDTSDSKAVVEKFIPFRINTINWTVDSKLVSYEWQCTPVGQDLAATTGRGTIPYDLQLTNTTVGALLKGPATYSTVQPDNASPGASTTTTDARGRATAASDPRVIGNNPAAPPTTGSAPTVKKTVTQGLMGALNDFQQDLVQRGIYVSADEYEIEFLGNDGVPASAIENATLQLPNQRVDKSKTAGGVQGSKNANSLRQEANPVDMKSRSFSITAGQQIIQAIELAIRNSSYISSQSLVVKNPDGSQSPSPNNRNKPMTWFNITMSAVQKPGPLDPERNDYAYKIKYTIVPYKPSNMVSKYFPTPKFPGVHKSYPFWFTGKNTAIKDYKESLNALYSLTVSGGSPKESAARLVAEETTSSMQEIVKYTHAPASNASRSGADGQSLEANANAAEVLYSPADLAKATVKIVGDPAWVMQGSMFKPLTGEAFIAASKTGFEPDGTVSFDSQDILFEVVWQRPEDYDIQSGIADPYRRTAANGQPRQPLQSRVYRAVKVVSEFKGGGFDQTLEGNLYLFPKPDRSNTANPAAAASSAATADGSDNRFSRQGAAVGGTGIGQATGGRVGEGTSTAGAGRSSPQFAASDPRRFDIGDGGKAAILGAQKSLAGSAKSLPDLTDSSDAASNDPNLSRSLASVAADVQVENAPSPGLPTSPEGGTATAKTAGSPPKLPGGSTSGAPQSARAIQTAQSIALLKAKAAQSSSVAAPAGGNQAAFEQEWEAAGGWPNNPTTPNNQKIARER